RIVLALPGLSRDIAARWIANAGLFRAGARRRRGEVMMISAARLEANRENAKHSTGPKSKGGKSHSSQNARQHDIISQEKLLASRDQKRLRRLREGLFKELRPSGVLERLCVNEFALTTFRRARIGRWESALITKNVRRAQGELEIEDLISGDEDDDDVSDETNPPKLSKVDIAAVSMVDEHELVLITRYERPLEKKAERLLAQLKRLQAERKSQTPEP